jgi:fluoride exporter
VKPLLLVFLGSGLGGVVRYGLGRLLSGWLPGYFPVATLGVNVLACLLVGLLAGWVDSRQLLGPAGRLLLVTGFCGGFSTFSTLAHEALHLMRDAPAWAAPAYLAASLLLGLGAAWVGMAVSCR